MYAYVNETTVQCNTMVLLPFSPLMPTTLLLIRFSCNLEGLLVMLLKKNPKIFLAVALQTKKFFFRSYMIESDRPYVNEVQK